MDNGSYYQAYERAWICRAASVAFGFGLAGCSAQSLNATLPKISALPGEPARIDASTQTVYGLIAAGAMRCWLSPNGELKKTHVFHADVEPPSKGGNAEISILERDVSGERIWGPRAFKVLLKATGDQTSIEVENLRMTEALAAAMRADVFAWAQGAGDCKLKPIEVAPPVAAQPAPKKSKVKSANRLAPTP